MNDHQPTNHHFNRVVPWAFDEFMLVDGLRCVYSHDKERGLLVHLPGRITHTVDELRQQGRTVVMPQRMRMLNTVTS
jgi:hypothetical protein